MVMLRNWCGLVTATVVLGMGGGVVGQEAGQPKNPAEVAKQPDQPAAPEVTLTVDFPGGTVKQYIEHLKHAAVRNPVNVVVSEAAMSSQIATISLRDVSLYTALQAIQGAAGRD